MQNENKKDLGLQRSTVPSTKLAYWTEGQVANRLGQSVAWLRVQRAKGRFIPFHRFGRNIKYKILDVLDFEEQSVVRFTGQT